MKALKDFTDLVPNANWASLPLFDRTGWRRMAFGDFAESIGVRAEPKDAQEEIYVGLEHLDPQCLHIRRWGKGSDVTGTKLRFRRGDIIFGRRRAYQRKLAVAEFDGICSAHAMVVRAKPALVLPEFLPFLMMSDRFMNRAVEISVGSLSPTINWTTLKLEEFDLPPLDQQHRIAEILWAMDEVAEEAWKSRVSILVLRKSAHREVFLCGLNNTNTGPSRSGLPSGWWETTVGEACVIENRLRKPINAAERAKLKGEYPYYGPTGVLDHLNEYRVDGEFVLIGEDGDHFLKFDSWNMTQHVRGKFNVNNHAHILRGTDKCRTEWIYQYFKHRDITPFLSRQGSGRLKMQKSVLEKMPFVVPPLQDQDVILAFLNDLDSSFGQINEHLDETKSLLASLTNVLFGLL
jgi:restriction endonuclease S subunit